MAFCAQCRRRSVPAMAAELVIASIERAGDHAAVMGVVLGVAVVGGLIYGLVRLAVRARGSRTQRGRDA
jgi:hypothetical protein